MLDPILAGRLQFGVATTIHIVFASLSIGLGPFLVYFVIQEIRTGTERYARLRRFFTKVFALGFVMGTVTGIPLGFLFGTNFAEFSTMAGEVIGGPLSFEVQMAFFLEAVFLGVLLFGRDRVADWFYALSAVLVALGAWISAFWILVVNSWMQTPRGFELVERGGTEVVQLTDPLAAFFNPRFPWMFVHMQTAALLSVALLVAGIAAYFVWRNRGGAAWRPTLKLAVGVVFVTSIFQVLHGDFYGRHVFETQPHKFAAMEAVFETTRGADLHIFAIPTSLESFTDPRAENLFTISIPYLASFLASGGDLATEVTGLNDFPYEAPPVAFVFWSFRFMVGLGIWFVVLGVWGAYRSYRGELFDADRYLQALVMSGPLGFVALILGWYVAEIGRQPWLIQDVLTTSAGSSAGLSGTEATLSLVGVTVAYVGMMVVFCLLVRRYVRSELGEEPATDDATGRSGVVAND
ncbi:cytochrome ubiquinol oxidase subunit I [Natronobacterium gregoryi]|uniref:Cytochrome bd ubiquinol oxidase subunit I n=2 Tax=Natronobacterium gregoryi TaxID=44930 RepID=L0AET9_NATGS|nr:cytochrome ubiquinol oxidase subunit I [Natronobacterium gregoryi]AFZ71575.1 cytochrome bd-type quinol oxidase, subunit 1 [Natronobacterium gregoryi SP2]ELY66632.1 cytochrome bd ubiquinol oxidase subunit I [Natronobacterium gregoryi SP2]PLK21344.1 cytochrome ubiquinol oxidase subunit I [Natronobacterium gregoryi SP2]SFI81341.1 cytochrome bd-I ubiquinol oxidase subunit 1 apoprotein [Natronobacterium gregoryi]